MVSNGTLPKFHDGNAELKDTAGKPVHTLADFWSWAHSDLMGNTERGILAEYIVACSLGIARSYLGRLTKYRNDNGFYFDFPSHLSVHKQRQRG